MAVNSIVEVNVSVQVAPTPETLQKSGAIVSVGGTITSPGTSSLLTELQDLIPLLTSPAAISAMTWTSGVVTVTTTAAHNLPIGSFLYLTIAGSVGSINANGYNGNWYCDVTGASAFTFVQPINPGTATVTAAAWVTEASVALLKKATTLFAQGSNQAVWVLETGALSDNNAIAFLSSYLTANPNSDYVPGAEGYFYSYLVPKSWDANTNYLALVSQYESPTAKTYFFTTTTLATWQVYLATEKSVYALIESPALGTWKTNVFTSATYAALTTVSPTASGQVTAGTTTAHGVLVGQWFQVTGFTPSTYNGWHQAAPGTTGSTLIWNVSADPGAESVLGSLLANQIPNVGVFTTEFSIAAHWFVTLNFNPGPGSPMTPTEYRFLFGVTPFPTRYMNALRFTLKQNSINVVGNGAEGGISDAIIVPGYTKDNQDFSVWYSIDWTQLNLDFNTANAVINGNNNRLNPLFYDQPGIDRLQAVGASTLSSAITFQMIQGTVVQTSLDGPVFAENISNDDYTDLCVINAVPFVTYSLENPGDYKIGLYAGFQALFIPKRGFDHIVYNVLVTELIAQ